MENEARKDITGAVAEHLTRLTGSHRKIHSGHSGPAVNWDDGPGGSDENWGETFRSSQRSLGLISANLNPRSFYVDTEIAAAWFEPGEVGKLRLRLWRELLGSPKGIETWAPVDFVTEWNKIAEYNEKASMGDRRGL